VEISLLTLVKLAKTETQTAWMAALVSACRRPVGGVQPLERRVLQFAEMVYFVVLKKIVMMEITPLMMAVPTVRLILTTFARMKESLVFRLFSAVMAVLMKEKLAMIGTEKMEMAVHPSASWKQVGLAVPCGMADVVEILCQP